MDKLTVEDMRYIVEILDKGKRDTVTIDGKEYYEIPQLGREEADALAKSIDAICALPEKA